MIHIQVLWGSTPISYLVGRERIFDDVTANNSNEYVTIKVDRHVVLAYT